VGPNQACYIPLGHRGGDMFAETPQMIDREAALARPSRCWKAMRC
jgi:DNA polymerase-1